VPVAGPRIGVTAPGRIIATTGTDRITAFAVDSGEAAWSRDAAERLRPGVGRVGPHGSADITGNDQTVLLDVVVDGDHGVELVDADTGEARWRRRIPGDVLGAIPIPGGVAIWTANRLIVLDADTGVGIGTVEIGVTAALDADPLIVVGGGRLHRIDTTAFTGQATSAGR
jgi:outer membrane protein assembly factor BamB